MLEGIELRSAQRAWVVFSNHTEIRILRFLKPGFRHCFVILHDGQNWITVDPMAHITLVNTLYAPGGFDLPLWLERRGHCVVEAVLNAPENRSAPPMMFTCVEACKRVLGVRDFFVITPWQLYRRLLPSEEYQPVSLRLAETVKTIYQRILQKGDVQWEA